MDFILGRVVFPLWCCGIDLPGELAASPFFGFGSGHAVCRGHRLGIHARAWARGADRGWAADRATSPLRWFLAVELGIACYGICSVAVIDLVMMHAGGLGHGVVMLGALFALIVPTTLMGMTLPILVILLDRVVLNIGEATGSLYLANTMGAASGAIGTGLYLFHIMDLRQVTWLAAAINAMVALGGWCLVRRAAA